MLRVEKRGTDFTICSSMMHIGRMGRFSSALLVLLAACGDNLGSDGFDPAPIDELDTGDPTGAIPRYRPAVCSAQSWDTSVNANTAMEVSVAARPGGAVALAAPRAGGELSGLVLDTRMAMLLEKSVAIDDAVSHVTVSNRDDRVVSATAHAGAVLLHLLDADLGNPELVTKIPGNALAEPTFFGILETEGDVVMPVGADDGVWLHHFDASFEPQGSNQLAATAPVRSIAAAHTGRTLLTAWSTDNECYVALSNAFGQGITASSSTACPDPRIAFDPQHGRGVVVFEDRDRGGIGITPILLAQFGGPSHLLRAGAKAPRVVFDGTNFWISHIDERGDIVVGFLDGNGDPVTMSLYGPKPDAAAYELAVVNGNPWVFALTSDGYAAYELCVDTQW